MRQSNNMDSPAIGALNWGSGSGVGIGNNDLVILWFKVKPKHCCVLVIFKKRKVLARIVSDALGPEGGQGRRKLGCCKYSVCCCSMVVTQVYMYVKIHRARLLNLCTLGKLFFNLAKFKNKSKAETCFCFVCKGKRGNHTWRSTHRGLEDQTSSTSSISVYG